MSAVFSPCGLYRYRLDRAVSMLSDRVVAFCLHNSSRAGAEANDPTSRRGIGFATAWGAGRLVYVLYGRDGVTPRPRAHHLIAAPTAVTSEPIATIATTSAIRQSMYPPAKKKSGIR